MVLLLHLRLAVGELGVSVSEGGLAATGVMWLPLGSCGDGDHLPLIL